MSAAKARVEEPDVGLKEDDEDDRRDLEAATRNEAEARAAGEEPIPLEQVRRELGL